MIDGLTRVVLNNSSRCYEWKCCDIAKQFLLLMNDAVHNK